MLGKKCENVIKEGSKEELESIRFWRLKGELDEEMAKKEIIYASQNLVRYDLSMESYLHTCFVNALYKAMYSVGENVITSFMDLCRGNNYCYFEPISEEQFCSVKKSVEKLKACKGGYYEVIAMRYGFYDGTMWAYEDIQSVLKSLTLENIITIEQNALVQLRNNDGYGMPKVIGFVLG